MSKAQAVRNKYEKAPTGRLLARFAASAGRVCLGVANAVAVGWGLAAAAGVAWGRGGAGTRGARPSHRWRADAAVLFLV